MRVYRQQKAPMAVVHSIQLLIRPGGTVCTIGSRRLRLLSRGFLCRHQMMYLDRLALERRGQVTGTTWLACPPRIAGRPRRIVLIRVGLCPEACRSPSTPACTASLPLATGNSLLVLRVLGHPASATSTGMGKTPKPFVPNKGGSRSTWCIPARNATPGVRCRRRRVWSLNRKVLVLELYDLETMA